MKYSPYFIPTENKSLVTKELQLPNYFSGRLYSFYTSDREDLEKIEMICKESGGRLLTYSTSES